MIQFYCSFLFSEDLSRELAQFIVMNRARSIKHLHSNSNLPAAGIIMSDKITDHIATWSRHLLTGGTRATHCDECHFNKRSHRNAVSSVALSGKPPNSWSDRWTTADRIQQSPVILIWYVDRSRVPLNPSVQILRDLVISTWSLPSMVCWNAFSLQVLLSELASC